MLGRRSSGSAMIWFHLAHAPSGGLLHFSTSKKPLKTLLVVVPELRQHSTPPERVAGGLGGSVIELVRRPRG
jgi:hypothetical protein